LLSFFQAPPPPPISVTRIMWSPLFHVCVFPPPIIVSFSKRSMLYQRETFSPELLIRLFSFVLEKRKELYAIDFFLLRFFSRIPEGVPDPPVPCPHENAECTTLRFYMQIFLQFFILSGATVQNLFEGCTQQYHSVSLATTFLCQNISTSLTGNSRKQEYIFVPEMWSSGQSSRSRCHGFDSRRYQIFSQVVGLKQGPLSLVSTTDEPFGRKSSGSGLENREYGRGDLSRWPRDTYTQKLALTSPTSGDRSAVIVHSQTQTAEFSF
jgi:hypothetical protein